MGNEYEDQARLLKAQRLAFAFETTVQAASGQEEAMDPGTVATIANDAPEGVWVDLAATAGIRRPSTRTIRLAVAYLEGIAANRATVQPDRRLEAARFDEEDKAATAYEKGLPGGKNAW